MDSIIMIKTPTFRYQVLCHVGFAYLMREKKSK
jgi:hypothetical protein